MSGQGNFRVGSITMLTTTVLVGAVAAAILFPLLKQQRLIPSQVVRPRPEQNLAAMSQSQKFAEFYPASLQTRDDSPDALPVVNARPAVVDGTSITAQVPATLQTSTPPETFSSASLPAPNRLTESTAWPAAQSVTVAEPALPAEAEVPVTAIDIFEPSKRTEV